jgi:hypothetical protein
MGREETDGYATDGHERSLSQHKSVKINPVYGEDGN